MEQLTAEVLMVLARGAAGQGAWQSLVEQVRRRPAGDGVGPDATGLPELAAFETAPGDPVLAQRLADALRVRAERDPEFARRLAGLLPVRDGVRVDGTNTISGGQQGTAVQAQYIGTLHIGGPGGRGAAG
ncbi:hypothetical protein ACFV1L_13740 [Kitasatospora sp. NPDC059646]|uniref:hypothetical protein n=1 Tax=Kitasatospora sp. NPDC059646 TaxID=3346893 RepID=UPI0036B61E14